MLVKFYATSLKYNVDSSVVRVECIQILYINKKVKNQKKSFDRFLLRIKR